MRRNFTRFRKEAIWIFGMRGHTSMRTVSTNLGKHRSFFMSLGSKMNLSPILELVLVLVTVYGLALLFTGAAISKVVSLAKFEGVVQNFRLLPRSLVKPVA